MLLYHQQDQVEKMYFEIVFNLSLHQVEDKATCQTQFYIFNFFLSPLWRHDSKIDNFINSSRLVSAAEPGQNAKPCAKINIFKRANLIGQEICPRGLLTNQIRPLNCL